MAPHSKSKIPYKWHCCLLGVTLSVIWLWHHKFIINKMLGCYGNIFQNWVYATYKHCDCIIKKRCMITAAMKRFQNFNLLSDWKVKVTSRNQPVTARNCSVTYYWPFGIAESYQLASNTPYLPLKIETEVQSVRKLCPLDPGRQRPRVALQILSSIIPSRTGGLPSLKRCADKYYGGLLKGGRIIFKRALIPKFWE